MQTIVLEIEHFLGEHIESCHQVEYDYDDHASDVWIVRTTRQTVVVRRNRFGCAIDLGPFPYCMYYLFGVDPSQISDLKSINNLLNNVSNIPAPQVLLCNNEYVAVEYMAGRSIDKFANEKDSVLESLGKFIATLHSHEFTWYGSPTERTKNDLCTFHEHMVRVMKAMVDKFWSDNQDVKENLNHMCSLVSNLEPPKACCLVMPDFGGSQFMTDGAQVTAVVDTEYYTVAPVLLDLVLLEANFTNNERCARLFKQGYESKRQFPSLSDVRTPYRFFIFVTDFCGKKDLHKWMNKQCTF
jgi:hypothetical protein